MAAKKNHGYGNDSISSLKGADRVRKRPGVILVSTDWRDANILFLKFFPTRLMRQGKDSETALF